MWVSGWAPSVAQTAPWSACSSAVLTRGERRSARPPVPRDPGGDHDHAAAGALERRASGRRPGAGRDRHRGRHGPGRRRQHRLDSPGRAHGDRRRGEPGEPALATRSDGDPGAARAGPRPGGRAAQRRQGPVPARGRRPRRDRLRRPAGSDLRPRGQVSRASRPRQRRGCRGPARAWTRSTPTCPGSRPWASGGPGPCRPGWRTGTKQRCTPADRSSWWTTWTWDRPPSRGVAWGETGACYSDSR